MQRYVHSFGSDLVNAMANGKIVTLKYFLLGLGLHNITDLRMPIKVLSHLGRCTDYNLVCEIKTAEAEIDLQWLAEHEISIFNKIMKTVMFNILFSDGLIISVRS